jgi:hypothetical protein
VDEGDLHFAFSIHNELMELILEPFESSMPRGYGVFVVSPVLAVWYAQYGFYGGIAYWLMRKKLPRPLALLCIVILFAVLFVFIYWRNGYFT